MGTSNSKKEISPYGLNIDHWQRLLVLLPMVFYSEVLMPKKDLTHVNITIINPESWGVKYNKTSQYYFQFRTDFFGNPQIATLSNEAKLLLLSIFSESSRRVYPTLSYCLEYACGLLKVPLGDAKGFLKELELNEIIHLERGVRVTKQIIQNKQSKQYVVEKTSCEKVINDTINYLNSKCGKSYRASSKKTQGIIKSLLDQDYGEEDFKLVVNHKNREWGKDEKMSQYLRPETLFGNKFENYLVEAKLESDKIKDLKAKVLGVVE